MTEEQPELDWDEVAGDVAIVAKHVQDVQTLDELAALMDIWDALLGPVLRSIPPKTWADAHELRTAFHEACQAREQEKLH